MGVKKMVIRAFGTNEYTSLKGKFTVLLNPESIKIDQQIDYANEQSDGSIGADLRFKQISPEKLTFKLYFDGTGVIQDVPQDLQNKTVPQQIQAFKKIVSDYNGELHRPQWLKVTWGTTTFKGVVTSLNFTYKLFDNNGMPLRAEADMTMTSSISAAAQKSAMNQKSPDLTRIWQLKAGDTLPSLCDEAYDGVNYFVQVAQANRLNRLRGLRVGESLTFPPLKKQ